MAESKRYVPYCPIDETFEPCDPGELQPIIEHLRVDDALAGEAVFPRGTHLPDGRLDLCKQRIGPEGAELVCAAAVQNRQTRHLLLGANGLGNRGAKAVATVARENQDLETLYLGCNLIESEGVDALAEALADNDHVCSLWLKRNPLGDGGAVRLASMLSANRTIRTLDLVQTELGVTGLEAIVPALCQSDSVSRLYLGGNKLGHESLPVLRRLIEQCNSLRHLFLGVNALGDVGATEIARALPLAPNLVTLSLSSNDIGAEGAEELAAACQKHPELKKLDLGHQTSAPILGAAANRMGDHGVIAFAEAIQNNGVQLHELDVRKNGITARGAQLLVDALEQNEHLCRLRIGKGIRDSDKQRLQQFLGRNQRSHPAPVIDPDIQAIQSVYRTAPPSRES